MKKLIPLFALSLLFISFAAFAQNALKDGTPRYVQVELVPEFEKIVPGQKLTIALDQVITEHWHTYWKNPGDSGEATRISWEMPNGFKAGDIQWPVPGRMPIGPLTNFGYAGHVTFLTDITVPETVSGQEVTIKADIEWLVCSDICVPETASISINLPVATKGETVTPNRPELFTQARASIPQNVAWQGMVEETMASSGGALILTFTPDAEQLPVLSQAKKIEFFPEEWGLILNAAVQDSTVDGNKVRLKIARDTRALTEIPEIKGVIAVENNEGVRKGYQVSTAITHAPAEMAAVLSETGQPEITGQQTPQNVKQASFASTITLLQALIFALLGGLVLNLMPCVFPILSMKALSLVSLTDKERSHAAIYGLSYTAGVLVCFALIAGGLIALQIAGNHIGWGFQLQNPIVVLLLAYLLFVVGLNLSGFFDFNIGGTGRFGQKWTQRHGYAGSFFTGMLATIVATPCTAPFMGVALGYALVQPPLVALLIFMTLGLGLALPYLLLCVAPPLRKMLPRPGLWMETFRQFLAFPMYASAAWLVWVYGQQVEGMYALLLALIGLVMIGFGIWIWKLTPKRRLSRLLVRFMALFAIAMAILIASFSMTRMPIEIKKLETETSAEASQAEHLPFTSQTFSDALAGKNPVFINMTASWCITCKVNERIALATDATIQLFKDQNVVYLVGDWTNQNPEITDFLKDFGRNGVPLYVYYGPRDPTTNQRPEPVVLPQLLTNGLVADIITNQ